VLVFRPHFALEDAIGSRACSLAAKRRAPNEIPLGRSLLLLFTPVSFVETLQEQLAVDCILTMNSVTTLVTSHDTEGTASSGGPNAF
jgi:hypothetical protein